jgi:hypothetical protein
MSAKSENHKFLQSIVDNLVKPEILKEKTAYGREYKIAQNLTKKYPDKTIWRNITFQVNSLAFFLTLDGKLEIEKTIGKINYKPQEKIREEISEEKFGENVEVKKALTLKEFLRR